MIMLNNLLPPQVHAGTLESPLLPVPSAGLRMIRVIRFASRKEHDWTTLSKKEDFQPGL